LLGVGFAEFGVGFAELGALGFTL